MKFRLVKQYLSQISFSTASSYPVPRRFTASVQDFTRELSCWVSHGYVAVASQVQIGLLTTWYRIVNCDSHAGTPRALNIFPALEIIDCQI